SDNAVVTKNLALIDTAMAGLGSVKPAVASLPGIHIAEQDPYTSWIERTSPTSVLLVTRPDPKAATLARSLSVLPRIASVTHVGNATKPPPKLEISRAAPPDDDAAAPACESTICTLPSGFGSFIGSERPIAEGSADAAREHRIQVAALYFGRWVPT